MAQSVGTGTTVTHGGFSGDVLSVDIGGVTVDNIDTSHMGTTSWKTFLAHDLADAGEVTIEIAWDITASVPTMGGTAQTLTINPTGNTDAAITASAFINSFSVGIPLEDKMTGSFGFKLSGEIG
jgi:hypothetical protein